MQEKDNLGRACLFSETKILLRRMYYTCSSATTFFQGKTDPDENEDWSGRSTDKQRAIDGLVKIRRLFVDSGIDRDLHPG